MEDFQEYRPLLFSIAYRMLGSATDAEDIVQDAYLRYLAADKSQIHSLKAYLSQIVTRLALDHLKSARVEREKYIGLWLPEPLLTNESDLPMNNKLELFESISIAFLTMLERLSPQERAIFLLHEVFDYSHQEIAETLDLSVANCRQVFHRAKEHIVKERPRFEPSREAQEKLVTSFVTACQEGDFATLTNILATDITTWSDGGGKTNAARRPVIGQNNVLKLLFGLMSKNPAVYFTYGQVNFSPAVFSWLEDILINVTCFQVADEQIKNIYTIVNPDKLVYLQNQLKAQQN
ncbi:MAG: RNA polymerase sigma-70 factor [Blastocatellia bacterium]